MSIPQPEKTKEEKSNGNIQVKYQYLRLALCTWDVCELHLLGHRSAFELQLLVPEAHHLPFECGRQQLLLPGLTQPVDVALRREAAETVLHEGEHVPEPPAGGGPLTGLSRRDERSLKWSCWFRGSSAFWLWSLQRQASEHEKREVWEIHFKIQLLHSVYSVF